MATIREKQPGVWEVRVFTGRDARGRPTQISRTVRGGKRDAQRLAVQLEGGPGRATDVTAWMDAGARPAVTPPATGFRLVSRDQDDDRPHHMIARNGDAVGQRLAECSLYRADLDLAVYDGDGAVAAYGLFWADPHTGVGLVEPMRTEEPFQQRGLARAVLTAGLDRLAAAGCTRFKVSYEPDNAAARHLYLTRGFTSTSTSRTWTRGRHH